jgi:hypothetical protein
MKIKFTVVGVFTQPNGTICVTLKNSGIPDEDKMQKNIEVDMFNPNKMVQQTMQMAIVQQQKMLGIEPNYSKIVMTKEQFDKCRVTAEDEFTIDVETGVEH